MKRPMFMSLCTGIGLGISLFTLSFSQETTTDSDRDVYRLRREVFINHMQDAIAVFQNQDEDDNFYYLTGLEEENAACVLMPETRQRFILFVRPFSPRRAVWSGNQAGIDGAMRVFGADTAFSILEFDNRLSRMIMRKSTVYCPMNQKELREKVMGIMGRSWSGQPEQIIDAQKLIHEMRVIKDEHEISLIRKAAKITCMAHIEAMKAVVPGMGENEVQAIIEYIFKKEGADGPGFPTIIGSGANSTVLHYEDNNQPIKKSDVIVMDIGAQFMRYTADVTRTIPAGGKFSPEQREIYNIVLKSYKTAVGKIRPGTGIQTVHNEAREVMREELLRLGLITDRDSEWQLDFYVLYNINHWIGLYVHDVGEYRRQDGVGRLLEPGMIFTVEPGLYFGDQYLQHLSSRTAGKVPVSEIENFIETIKPVYEKYKNIGIRIEDDFLVTAEGSENLSALAPVEINEIEKLMKKNSALNSNDIGH